MSKRGLLTLTLLLALACAPVGALDFHHWRTDGQFRAGTSLGQQSSNAAFNQFESYLDPASGSFALYWETEHQQNGGTTDAANPEFGDLPPTSPIRDNRPQDPEIDWDSWAPVNSKLVDPPRPLFTPNIPQAWSPVVVDVGSLGGSFEHVLIQTTFEQLAVGAPLNMPSQREQILSAYFPETSGGLPGNASAIPPADRGTVRPFWLRNDNRQTPGLRIRELAPLAATNNAANPGVGVVTHPLIMARVPANFQSNGTPVSRSIPVVYMVVGTGETGDFARVICLALERLNKDPGNTADDNDWLPDPANLAGLRPSRTVEPPDPAFFNPNSGTGGAVLWSYTVRSRSGNNPVPVAGVSFANVGPTGVSLPLLFVTTADGQIICLNAKAADISDITQDGDPIIDPNDPAPRWTWETSSVTPADTGIPETPGFLYGMAPAVARVPLAGAFSGTGPTANTLANAMTQHNVTDWEVFVADTYGTFYAFDAQGKPVRNMAMMLTRWDPLPRWQVDPPGNTFRRDPRGGLLRERFISPPVVYQGGTPLNQSDGVTVSSSADVGFDDQVSFASERGRIYTYDCLGRFTIGGANDGRPTGVTDLRWQFPEQDTAFQPATFQEEPRNWPRELPNPRATGVGRNRTLERLFGDEINPGRDYYSRAPMAVALGGNANPDSPNPNLDIGDDNLFVPYMQRGVPNAANRPHIPQNFSQKYLYEYVGSMKPYGFVQASRAIASLTRVEVNFGAGFVDMPLSRARVGTIKENGLPTSEVQTILAPGTGAGSPNPTYDPGGPLPTDTVYITAPNWYDEQAGVWRVMPLDAGLQVRITYESPTAPLAATTQTVTETLPYPSCYREEVDFDPANPAAPPTVNIYRGRASLTAAHNRLEQRQVTRPNAMGLPRVDDEEPAEVPDALFLINPDPLDPQFTGEGWRQPALFAAGRSSGLGVLMVPSFFRGRVIAFDHRLRAQRVILGNFDPKLQFTGGGVPDFPFGPAADPSRHFTYDPGVFYPSPTDPQNDLVNEDFRKIADVGGSVTLVDGWMYVTYRNGLLRAYSNGIGPGGPGFYNPPYWENLPSGIGNAGTLVKAPVSIRLLNGPWTPGQPHPGYRDQMPGDGAFLFDWAEPIYVEVDFGDASNLQPRQTTDPHAPLAEIDGLVLENPVQGQIQTSSGQVLTPRPNGQQRPQILDHDNNPATPDRVVAYIQFNAGVPSQTQPLTPGTPLLHERQPLDAMGNPNTMGANFDGELVYGLQVTQPGLQWRWGPYQWNFPMNPGAGGRPDPQKVHFWELERNQTMGGTAVRFATTGGTDAMGNPRWRWDADPLTPGFQTPEWAPLISYNNPILMDYDPDGSPALNNVMGIVRPSGGTWVPLSEPIGRNNNAPYTDRNAPGRKNGDMYVNPSVDGSHSGNGQPIVPIVGMATVLRQGQPEGKQILYADHGKTTPVSTSFLPDVGKLLVGDRSYMTQFGLNLSLRVERAPLTKMGKGADYGTRGNAALRNLAGAPVGSFEQNVNSWDHGPDGFYAGIPESRVLVTRLGTNQDLSLAPVRVAGRLANGAVPGRMELDQLGVQVDVPLYTPDDIYSTRWRSALPQGSPPWDATQIINGIRGSAYNPFFPGTIFGEQGRPLWDRSERLAKMPPQPPNAVPRMAPGEDAASPHPDLQSDYDDRMRRIVLFHDSNNNGQLDLTANYREAYRTFGLQVMVKPELKLEAQTAAVDLGAVWHGKRQPGTGAEPPAGPDPLAIREWQLMQAWRAAGSPIQQKVANFYSQYWRPFTLLNTGNVNLAFVKPELRFRLPNTPPLIVGLQAEGNDAWRALGLVNPLLAANLRDPLQIFLRTSFDDMMLPDGSADYGAGLRGIWLQKAPVGASQAGAVAYAERSGSPTGNPLLRDPTNLVSGQRTAEPRDTWISMNIPTGSVLGQYSGQIRFYNDRNVSLNLPGGLAELRSRPAGYIYQTAGNPVDGELDRDAAGDPQEPVTNPPLRVKVKVIENMIHGRGVDAIAAEQSPDADRRVLPTAVPDIATSTADGSVRRIILAYATNGRGLGQARPLQDIAASQLQYDTTRLLFPYDELSLVRGPWRMLSNPAALGWDVLTAAVPGVISGKPSLTQDETGAGALAWTERTTLAPGSDQYRIWYQFLGGPSPTPPQVLTPGGQAPDVNVPVQGARIVPAIAPAGNRRDWFAIFARGAGTRRTLGYNFLSEDNSGNRSPWSPSSSLPTSSSFSNVEDPNMFVTQPFPRLPGALAPPPMGVPEPAHIAAERAALPQMGWLSYSATSRFTGRTDLYVSRYRIAALASAAQRGIADLQGSAQDFARVGFARVELEVLRGNPSRTQYHASGLDWIVYPSSPVQVFLSRPDLPANAAGSLANPIQLIDPNEMAPFASSGELVFPIASPYRSIPEVARTRVIVDKAAGLIRFTQDIRTLARYILPNPPMTPADPDPVIRASYTPSTLRITSGDVGSGDPAVVPTISQPNGVAIVDASWYRQQIDGKYAAGVPVAGIADRLWVFWRRTGGAVSAGPSVYFKVLRPGIRVRASALHSIAPNDLTVRINGNQVIPEEVNPVNGQIYFPAAFEGQTVQVSYRLPNGSVQTDNPPHVITWLDESGERPVPMETSVNEGSLDSFASFEDVPMTPLGSAQAQPFRHLERIWLFWSSTRGSAGDLFYAAISPRLGPEANVGGSVTLKDANPIELLRFSPSTVQARLAQQAQLQSRRSFTVPPVARPGPLVQNSRGASGRRR